MTKRQETIIDIYKQDISDQQVFLDRTLHSALEMTGSQYGYIYLYDEKKKEFELNSWTNVVMSHCKIMDKKTIYQLEKTGIWGEVVRQRKPIIVNDFQAPNLLKKGYPQGHVALLNYASFPVFNDGNIVAVVGLGNNKNGYTEFDVNQLTLLMQSAWLIKETKQNALKKNQERQKYDNILNSITVLVCEFAKDSTLIYVNDEYCEYFGYIKENLIGKPFLELIPEEEREAAKQQYLSLTPEKPVSAYSHHVLKGDEVRLMEWKDVAIFDEYKTLINYYSVGIDITERKRQEEQDKNELARLRSVIEDNSAVILIIEPETGKILDANPDAADFYGYNKD